MDPAPFGWKRHCFPHINQISFGKNHYYPLVNKLVDPENHQFLMETSLPTPTSARVYVNLPEGT
jgi:hypothetical protein